MESSAIGAGLFLLGEPMTDILQAAQSYKQLLDVEYQILLGKKNNTLSISVTFEDTHFFHLAGLQYLKDLKKLLTGNRGRFFRSILKGNISQKIIEKSQFYPKIKSRIECLTFLEQIMDLNETIFKYNPRLESFSAIQADFLLKNEIQARNIFTFLSEDKSSGKYFCRSFFPQTDKDYSIGQTNWALLYKKKIYKSTGKEYVLYDRLNKNL